MLVKNLTFLRKSARIEPILMKKWEIAMAKNEIKLSENVNSITIDVVRADISIYPANVEVPIVRTTGEIDVKERYSEAIIKENQSKNTNGVTMFSSGSFQISNRFGGINIVDGKIISGNIENVTIVNPDEESNVELIVPKKPQIQTFSVDTMSGNLTIEELIFSRLVAKTMNGNITLNDIDILFGKLKTMSGDIEAKILESIMNYRTYLNSMSGDVNILFKGKR